MGRRIQDRDEIVQSWESNASAWKKAVRGNRIASRVAGTDAAILQAIGNELPCRVLDVGSGEGWLAHTLSRRGFEVVGMDGSAELIARAREGPGRFFHLTYAELCTDPLVPDGGLIALSAITQSLRRTLCRC